MKLDRAYQLQLLQMLAEFYPNSFNPKEYFNEMPQEEEEKYAANMAYLDEHGLVESRIETNMAGVYTFLPPKITAKGMDFLADDGGLSAILGVVTVKFHEETLREMMENRIAYSDIPQTEKKKLTDGLRSLPADSIKHLTMKLLDKGLENLPAALPLIQTALQSFQG